MKHRKMRKLIKRRDGKIQHYNVVPESVKKQIIKARFEEAAKELKKDGRVRLPGIGILRVKWKKARAAGTMPDRFHPGQTIKVKARPKRRVVRFRAAKELKEMIE